MFNNAYQRLSNKNIQSNCFSRREPKIIFLLRIMSIFRPKESFLCTTPISCPKIFSSSWNGCCSDGWLLGCLAALGGSLVLGAAGCGWLIVAVRIIYENEIYWKMEERETERGRDRRKAFGANK
jgi:hypothetical protein